MPTSETVSPTAARVPNSVPDETARDDETTEPETDTPGRRSTKGPRQPTARRGRGPVHQAEASCAQPAISAATRIASTKLATHRPRPGIIGLAPPASVRRSRRGLGGRRSGSGPVRRRAGSARRGARRRCSSSRRPGALADRVDVVAQLAELVGELGRDRRDPAVERFEADGQAGDLGPDRLEVGVGDRRRRARCRRLGWRRRDRRSIRSVSERIFEPSSALAASDSSSRSRSSPRPVRRRSSSPGSSLRRLNSPMARLSP